METPGVAMNKTRNAVILHQLGHVNGRGARCEREEKQWQARKRCGGRVRRIGLLRKQRGLIPTICTCTRTVHKTISMIGWIADSNGLQRERRGGRGNEGNFSVCEV